MTSRLVGKGPGVFTPGDIETAPSGTILVADFSQARVVAVDPGTGDRIGELLFEMNRTRGTALVVVTHNERLAQRLGRTVLLEEGRAVPAGSFPGSG